LGRADFQEKTPQKKKPGGSFKYSRGEKNALSVPRTIKKTKMAGNCEPGDKSKLEKLTAELRFQEKTRKKKKEQKIPQTLPKKKNWIRALTPKRNLPAPDPRWGETGQKSSQNKKTPKQKPNKW